MPPQRTLQCLALALLLSAACDQKLDNPTPPDTARIQARYDAPPGLLTAPDIEKVAEAFTEQEELVRETDSLAVVGNLLDSVSTNDDVIEDGDQVDDTRGARLLAVGKVTRICRGPEGDDVIDAERFGVMRLTFKGSGRGLFPIVWGTFEDCSDHTLDGREYTIDGDYSLTLRRRAEGEDLLFVFRGTIESSRVSFDGTFDFRVRDDGTTELRVSTSEGDVVVAASARGELITHDREGVWICDPSALSCRNMETGATIQAEGAP